MKAPPQGPLETIDPAGRFGRPCSITSRLRRERWSQGVEYLNPDDVAQERFGDWNSPEAVRNAAAW